MKWNEWPGDFFNIISFPNFPSTKQGHETKQTKLRPRLFCGGSEKSRLEHDVLAMRCFNFFLNFSLDVFLEYVHVVFHLIQVASEPASEFMEGLQRTLQVTLLYVAKTRLEQLLAMPYVVLWSLRCVETLVSNIGYVTAVQTVHASSTQMSLQLIYRSLN